MSFVDDMNYDMDNQSNSRSGNGGGRNTRGTCFTCGQAGHKKANCPSNMGRNAQNQTGGGQNQRGNRRGSPNTPQPHPRQGGGGGQVQKYCDNCPHLSNHTTAECKKNKNRNNNTNEFKKTGPRASHDVDSVQELNYCPTCNSTAHTAASCALKNNSCVIRCDKCGIAGHTRDECQNPVKRRCSNCYVAGYDTSHCKCTTEGVNWAHIYFSRATRNRPAFKFRLPTWDQASGLPPLNSQGPKAVRKTSDIPMPTISEMPEVRALPGPMTRGRLRSIVSGANVSKTFLGGGLPTEIRKHVVAAAALYGPSNANRLFQKYERDLVRMGILEWQTVWQAKYFIGQGYQFLREPRAMEAIARRQRPKCGNCGSFGVFLDAKMQTIPIGANVLDLRDFDDWGIFVVFDCQCCNQGFAYV